MELDRHQQKNTAKINFRASRSGGAAPSDRHFFLSSTPQQKRAGNGVWVFIHPADQPFSRLYVLVYKCISDHFLSLPAPVPESWPLR